MNKLMLIAIAAVVLVGCGKPSVSIHTASRQGNVKIVEAHLDYGTDINERNSGTENTPLHAAIAENKVDIVKLLIRRGASLNIQNFNGDTPLDFVMIIRGIEKFQEVKLSDNYKQPEIFNLLRKHGGKTGEELKAEGK